MCPSVTTILAPGCVPADRASTPGNTLKISSAVRLRTRFWLQINSSFVAYSRFFAIQSRSCRFDFQPTRRLNQLPFCPFYQPVLSYGVFDGTNDSPVADNAISIHGAREHNLKNL